MNAGRPRATDVYGTMTMYGGAGYYGYECACKPGSLYACDKEGDDMWNHTLRCPLQVNPS